MTQPNHQEESLSLFREKFDANDFAMESEDYDLGEYTDISKIETFLRERYADLEKRVEEMRDHYANTVKDIIASKDYDYTSAVRFTAKKTVCDDVLNIIRGDSK